ncbi:MAG TPA: tetratricopeptide repeat protein, partial [Verrucomicrobiales bacterium]|nr:tetratricopeptide repeat protein [Verrucomicrobiales bacterium]
MGGTPKPAPSRRLSLPALALACVILAPAPAHAAADPGPATVAQLRTQAEQALRDHFPARAASLLRQVLAREDVDKEQRPGLSLLLVEAQLRAGQAAEAQFLLETSVPGDHSERPYWQTMIHALQDRKEEAVFTARQALPLVSPRLRPSLILTVAALLEDTGHPEEAVASLQPLLDAPEGPIRDQARLRAALILRRHGKLREARDMLEFQPAEGAYLAAYLRWLRAEIDLASNAFAAAASAFEDLIDDGDRTPSDLASLSEIGRIQALLGLRQTDAALENVSVFVSGDRSSNEIETALDLLHSQKLLGDSRIRSLLETWSSGEEANRQAVASFFLALNLIETGDVDQAMTLLSRFEGDLAQHDIAPRAILLLGELQLRRGNLAQASRLVEDLFEAVQDDSLQLNRKWKFLTGEIQALRGDLRDARDTFRSQRFLLPDATGAHARYNAALLSHLLGQQRAFDEDWNVYTALPVALASEGKADILLEAGLSKTAVGDPEGIEDLKTFLQEYPEHARVPEALLTLAEHHLSA